ncbi:AAA family ATPase [Synechococcus sp. CS-1330]|nr:AAA family ATPase [Synechococcus sp. CS-1330]
MAAGRVGISQPGHNHKQEAITRRYGELKAAGVAGVVYVADNDQTGNRKAQKCAACAEGVGLPFLWLPAIRIWGDDLPIGGSIDDAQGSAVERFCALEVAVEAHLELDLEAPVDDTAQDLTVMLERCAQRVLELPLEHRSHTLRAMAKDLGASLSGRDVDRLIASARSRRDGRGARRRGRRTLEVKATPWLWEGLLIGQAINIMGALPKVGKTSLLIQAIAAWHQGAVSFLGQRFIGPCPPLILIGTDQPAADWARMLQGAQLHAGADPDGLTTPVREIWTMEDGFVLNEEGMEMCGDLAREYPGALFLVDSVAAAVTTPLGIPEESPEIAEPLRRLHAVVAPHGGTSVFIAHAGKGRAGDDPIRALRGSTALPAVASQILGLSRLSDAPGDDRLILLTQGRGGHPLKLLVSRDHEGKFVSDGDAASVIISQRLQEAENRLTEDQTDTLQRLRNRHADGLDTSVADLATDNSRQALDRSRTLLRGLKRAGLATSRKATTASGQRELWEPFALPSQGLHHDPSKPSLPSHTKGCEGFEGSEALPVGPLSGVIFHLMTRCAETFHEASPQELALCCADQHPELQNENLDDLVAIAIQISK